MSLTKKYIEKKYNVYLVRDRDMGNHCLYWDCFNNEEDMNWLCDGWTLNEIECKLVGMV